MILFRDNQSLKINIADRPILSQMHIQPIPLSLISPCSQSIKNEPPNPPTAEFLTDLSGLKSCVTMLPGSMILCSLGRSCFAKLYHQKQHCQQCASSLSLSLSLSLSSLSSQGSDKRVTYGVVGSAVCKFLADELVHPGFLLVIIVVVVVVVVGAHEAWDDEGHGGLRWLRVQLRGVFSVLILISKKLGMLMVGS